MIRHVGDFGLLFKFSRTVVFGPHQAPMPTFFTFRLKYGLIPAQLQSLISLNSQIGTDPGFIYR